MHICTKILMLACASLLAVSTSVAGSPTEMDEAHLSFMRSEEKLARDVVPDDRLDVRRSFDFLRYRDTIGTNPHRHHAEDARQISTFRIRNRARRPVSCPPDDQLGVFENPYFADYFTEKYDLLVGLAGIGSGRGSVRRRDHRRARHARHRLLQLGGVRPVLSGAAGVSGLWRAGRNHVKSLQNTLGSLMAGSENHLCAFVSQLGPMIDGCYESQVLRQQQVRDIIEAECSEFIGFVCGPETP